MNEIYWITRFDNLHGLAIAITAISGCIAFIFLMMHLEMDDNKGYLARCFKALTMTFIGIAMIILIPTTNEALLIYGVGGAVDYVKSNDKAKQLPDKVVEYLNLWVENMTEEEKKK